jgi:2-haloacid dehalogenase
MNEESIPLRPKVILLDVYETILEMGEVERKVNALLNSKRGYTIWFELFMQYCFVDNCTGQFNDFSSIAKATLSMAAKKLDSKLRGDESNNILELMQHLPVKDGVQEGLSILHGMDFRIAALTNAPENTVRLRMERTGLISYFEAVLSAERIKKYKPCCEVYQWAADKLDVKPEEILVISSHGWDIAGAAHSGMQTAYLKQSREMLYPLAPEAGLVGESLVALAEGLRGR